MANTCQSCGAVNREGARFCDKCGAQLDGGAQPAAAASGSVAAPAAKRSFNWTALALIVVILGVLGWLLFGPKEAGDSLTASGANAKNPHAEAANPDEAMGQMMSQLDDAKQKIAANPLDTASLMVLYQTFGTINRQEKIRPYLDTALTELEKQAVTLGEEKTQQIAVDLASAASAGNDAEGALLAIEKLYKIQPNNVNALAMLGDANFDMQRPDEAIKWYDMYLKTATPDAQGEIYWNAYVDRSTMLVQSAEKKKDPSLIKKAIADLVEVTTQRPEFYNAWFNLGIAYGKASDKAHAEDAFNKALAVAANEMDKWSAQNQLAILKGETPPPMPKNPHGEGAGATGGMPGGGMEGMPSPHGGAGADSGAGGGANMPNPHGGAGAGGDADANPHGGTGTDAAQTGTT